MSPALSAPQSPLVPQQQLLSDDWKQEISARLDRLSTAPPAAVKPRTSRTPIDSRATKIARAVASRYASAPTYSELIAAETARAEAEQRAHANQATDIVGDLFQDLDAEASAQPTPTNSEATSVALHSAADQGPILPRIPGTPVMPQFAERTREMRLHQAEQEPEPTLEDLLASALIEPRAVLPSKLIEFPRELISPRRARPHLPEDPTRSQAPAFPEESPAQLRIFEVQPEIEVQTQIEAAIRSDLPLTAEEAAKAQRKAIEEFVAGVQNSVSAAINSQVSEKTGGRRGWNSHRARHDPRTRQGHSSAAHFNSPDPGAFDNDAV